MSKEKTNISVCDSEFLGHILALQTVVREQGREIREIKERLDKLKFELDRDVYPYLRNDDT